LRLDRLTVFLASALSQRRHAIKLQRVFLPTFAINPDFSFLRFHVLVALTLDEKTLFLI
jgi:hypothetical protein